MKLADFEKEVLRILLKPEFNHLEIEDIVSNSSISGCDFTGVGYFLELTHRLFPTERKVISKPTLIGKTGDFTVGFLLFLENNALTLECHDWGDVNPPADIRRRKICIERLETNN